MHVFFTGGTGYIGAHLVRHFRGAGHDCTVVSRGGTTPWEDPAVRVLQADPKHGGPWQEAIDGADLVINLAGAVLVDPPHRWTDERKRMIRSSRVETTQRVVEAIAAADRPPTRLVSGSAVGYYGDRGDEILEESAPAGEDFLAGVCRDWEAAAREIAPRCAVTLLRTAPVLGRGSPLLQPMLTPFKLGLGGPWGGGRQWWPWIQIADVVGLVGHVVDRGLDGPVNLAAPAPVRVEEFAKTLGEVLNRPAVARIPAFALRVALGEAADALLASQRVVPGRAQQSGYAFRYAALEEALEESV